MHPRALLDRFGYRPKKRLGQNFLIDPAAAARIAALAGDAPRIVEIGPGTGALTVALLQTNAAITAIDIDEDMIRILRSLPELQRAAMVHADALTFDYAGFAAGERWNIAGNLPYNIATPLIMRLIEMQNGPHELVVMVQKEVAQRMSAVPGTRAYGSLSVALQYAMTIERAFTLGPGSFYPRPKIESAVLVLRRRAAKAVSVGDEPYFLQVVRAAFAYRRKTLANSLSLALDVQRGAVADALAAIGLNTEIRGEQLGLTDFARLADRLRGG
ncbi:MAG: 16S rRNA (adenine(1518)-N(6)/adenine(1519)-N(6))-dimethyltransferase RsmA [Candidatus Baltobacteraceae bacterium]